MKISIRKGLGFGLTSGIITTLGLIIGLIYSTHSKLVVLTGILTIAIADSFSDALGIHISEESGNKRITKKEIWESTLATFFSISFIFPFLIFSLINAMILSIIWGMFLIILFSYYISKIQEANPWKAILEHVLITIFVIFATYFIGSWISNIFA